MFTEPVETSKKLRLMIFGWGGTGKTHLALSFPNPAVIDLEGKTDFFASKFKFKSVKAKSFGNVEEALDFLEKNPGSFKTIVIDGASIIYNSLKSAGQKAAENRKSSSDGMAHKDWGVLKNKVNALLERLYNSQFHIVITCHSKQEMETKIETYDFDKKLDFWADFIINLTVDNKGSRQGKIIKDQYGIFKVNSLIKDPNFETFRKILEKAKNDDSKPQIQIPVQQDEADISIFQQTSQLQSKPQIVQPVQPVIIPVITKEELAAQVSRLAKELGFQKPQITELFQYYKERQARFELREGIRSFPEFLVKIKESNNFLDLKSEKLMEILQEFKKIDVENKTDYIQHLRGLAQQKMTELHNQSQTAA